jgi:ribosomal-protein-alanine N-acetyltransferase
MTILETTRLILRPPGGGDAEALVAALNNFNISRWTCRIPHPYGPADAAAFVEYCRNLPVDDVVLLITHGGEAIGVIGIERGELGYWLAEPHWGRGYATEAAHAIADHHFASPGNRSLTASYFPGNAASGRILEKLGFEFQGTGTASSRANKTDVKIIKLLLTRERWQQTNPATRY